MKLFQVLAAIVFLTSCSPQKEYHFLEGRTMGTTYHITYKGDKPEWVQKEINALLVDFNMSLSTYIDSSLISQFNKSDEGILLSPGEENYFLHVLETSQEVHEQTSGTFDPTVMPLINFYGFGYEKKNRSEVPDTSLLRDIFQLVGFEKVGIKTVNDKIMISKDLPGVQLDFSSIAKGYAVDVVAEFLEEKGFIDHLVEIGGESRAKGLNPKGRIWNIGINVPDPQAPVNDYLFPVRLDGLSVATSGNYRNFYTVDNMSFVHIVDPLTGLSKTSDVLSATIVHSRCEIADAYATACIVLGSQKALSLIESVAGLEACFILSEEGQYKTIYTSGFKNYLDE
jgi:thiamine biosynthesis lipoprotein